MELGCIPSLDCNGLNKCISPKHFKIFFLLIPQFPDYRDCSFLTLIAPRKSASENVVCLCRLLHLLANFSNLQFAYRQTVWIQIRLLLKEQSDLGPHCLQK